MDVGSVIKHILECESFNQNIPLTVGKVCGVCSRWDYSVWIRRKNHFTVCYFYIFRTFEKIRHSEGMMYRYVVQSDVLTLLEIECRSISVLFSVAFRAKQWTDWWVVFLFLVYTQVAVREFHHLWRVAVHILCAGHYFLLDIVERQCAA